MAWCGRGRGSGGGGVSVCALTHMGSRDGMMWVCGCGCWCVCMGGAGDVRVCGDESLGVGVCACGGAGDVRVCGGESLGSEPQLLHYCQGYIQWHRREKSRVHVCSADDS